jgi:hypothetical protein
MSYYYNELGRLLQSLNNINENLVELKELKAGQERQEKLLTEILQALRVIANK